MKNFLILLLYSDWSKVFKGRCFVWRR